MPVPGGRRECDLPAILAWRSGAKNLARGKRTLDLKDYRALGARVLAHLRLLVTNMPPIA